MNHRRKTVIKATRPCTFPEDNAAERAPKTAYPKVADAFRKHYIRATTAVVGVANDVTDLAPRSHLLDTKRIILKRRQRTLLGLAVAEVLPYAGYSGRVG